MISAFIFTMGFTAMSTYFLSQNPELANDTRLVITWIKQNEPDLKQIIVYSERLPSILFNSDYQVIFVYGGDESLNRETQFQQNEQWKSSLINLKSDSDWIVERAVDHSIWISKAGKRLPDLKGRGEWIELEVVDGFRIGKE